ncbi:MAG: enoyl-CoA hydratase/isomerase family protein [Elusimicrobia bacterium]|nr:enoyl-CoA hydratase/isomerase family protein [Elusimicrobiota bacterium]
MGYETIKLEKSGKIAEVRLNRPEVRNAFNAAMVAEVRDAFAALAADASVRCVVIAGEGPAFCAGVDLKWLGGGVDLPREKHLAETMDIARMFRAIYDLDKPVLAVVHGTTLGGGVGFLGVADIVLAAQDAVFGLSEVKIGVVPACISPYLLLRAARPSRLKELFISGRRFSAQEGHAAGLVDYVVEPAKLPQEARDMASGLLNAGPLAQATCKELFRRVPGMPLDESMRYTAEVLADLKTGPEARRGIAAFLQKKELRWD